MNLDKTCLEALPPKRIFIYICTSLILIFRSHFKSFIFDLTESCTNTVSAAVLNLDQFTHTRAELNRLRHFIWKIYFFFILFLFSMQHFLGNKASTLLCIIMRTLFDKLDEWEKTTKIIKCKLF